MIKRYLVSQRFGHILCTIRLAEQDPGRVRLSSLRPAGRFVDFSFDQNELAAVHPDVSVWPEALTRVAIAQAHRNFIRFSRVFDESCEQLDFQIRPWIGAITVEAERPADAPQAPPPPRKVDV
jgi:hypothetical protein